jgi:hypothetical protein
MAFVRSKVVDGRTYYQLVHNYRSAGKHRQKVLCHLGKHSSLALAIEDKSREEEELRNKSAEFFREMTEINQSILDRQGETLGQQMPSVEEAAAALKEAYESLDGYWGYPYAHPEHHKHRELWRRAQDLYDSVRRYHSLGDDACWYDDRANEVQEKKDKLIEFKEKYPPL